MAITHQKKTSALFPKLYSARGGTGKGSFRRRGGRCHSRKKGRRERLSMRSVSVTRLRLSSDDAVCTAAEKTYCTNTHTLTQSNVVHTEIVAFIALTTIILTSFSSSSSNCEDCTNKTAVQSVVSVLLSVHLGMQQQQQECVCVCVFALLVRRDAIPPLLLYQLYTAACLPSHLPVAFLLPKSQFSNVDQKGKHRGTT